MTSSYTIHIPPVEFGGGAEGGGGAGTGGFLINAHQHILEKATSKDILDYDADGMAHHLTLAPGASAGVGDGLQDDARKFMKGKKYLRGFDNDSGMTMLRIGSMNLMLHIIPLWDGIQSPQFFYMDTLSKGYDGAGEFDVILMNPPFKGAVDKGDVHPDLPSDTTKSELLFLHLILRALDMGGRASVIVPDGVLPKGVRAAPMWRCASASSKRIGWTAWSRHLHLQRRCKCAFGRLQAVRGGEHGGAVLYARRTDGGGVRGVAPSVLRTSPPNAEEHGIWGRTRN